MKQFTRTILLFALLLLLSGTTLFAQDWSPGQKEVWKNVEAYWARDAAGDLDGFMSYFHENYIGWELNQAMPGKKTTVRKMLDHEYKTEKTLLYDITPVTINVFGNVAIVNYYFRRTIKPADGSEKEITGRWADILMKQGDKWVLIGDHGGQVSK